MIYYIIILLLYYIILWIRVSGRTDVNKISET